MICCTHVCALYCTTVARVMSRTSVKTYVLLNNKMLQASCYLILVFPITQFTCCNKHKVMLTQLWFTVVCCSTVTSCTAFQQHAVISVLSTQCDACTMEQCVNALPVWKGSSLFSVRSVALSASKKHWWACMCLIECEKMPCPNSTIDAISVATTADAGTAGGGAARKSGATDAGAAGVGTTRRSGVADAGAAGGGTARRSAAADAGAAGGGTTRMSAAADASPDKAYDVNLCKGSVSCSGPIGHGEVPSAASNDKSLGLFFCICPSKSPPNPLSDPLVWQLSQDWQSPHPPQLASCLIACVKGPPFHEPHGQWQTVHRTSGFVPRSDDRTGKQPW